MFKLKGTEYTITNPETIFLITCKHKEYQQGGCSACWHCPKCEQIGCDNLPSDFFKPGVKIINERCQNENISVDHD